MQIPHLYKNIRVGAAAYRTRVFDSRYNYRRTSSDSLSPNKILLSEQLQTSNSIPQ